MSESLPDTANTVSDMGALKALSHPVRLALLEILLDGPLTATEAGERLGETAASCSFHLRQLERFGFVEIDSVGPGRRRTWRRLQLNWSLPATVNDEDGREALARVQSAMLDRFFGQVRDAVAATSGEPGEWRDAMLATQSTFFLTADELREYSLAFAQFNAKFVHQWGRRTEDVDARPAKSRQVTLLAFGVPVDNNLFSEDPVG